MAQNFFHNWDLKKKINYFLPHKFLMVPFNKESSLQLGWGDSGWIRAYHFYLCTQSPAFCRSCVGLLLIQTAPASVHLLHTQTGPVSLHLSSAVCGTDASFLHTGDMNTRWVPCTLWQLGGGCPRVKCSWAVLMSWGSVHRLLVFSLWRHSFPWDCPKTVQTSSVHSCELGLMQCVCSCSRCPRPVPALATCWTLRQKEMAARLELGSRRSTWARQWRRLSRRSSLSRGRCTCAGKEGMGLGTEEREMISFERCLAH